MTEEEKRLRQSDAHENDWKLWGPFLSERAWGTVREDYSADGSAWEFFPHDQARSKAYRWNEDGMLGISDRSQLLCFAIALWNGKDPIIKERMFGLTGNQGNHGEDVKEVYYFLDSTPTHSYMKALYRYPQKAYPYDDLIYTNRNRSRFDPEYELIDTGIFNENRFFDVTVEYAKEDIEDILIRISVINHGPDAAPLTLMPTLWFRNTWAWEPGQTRPKIELDTRTSPEAQILKTSHPHQQDYLLYCQDGVHDLEFLFTENETNFKKLYGSQNDNPSKYVKDGINDAIISGKRDTVNPDKVGSKVAATYTMVIQPGETKVIKLRLSRNTHEEDPLAHVFDNTFDTRIAEADAFYSTTSPEHVSLEAKRIQRLAFAGMLWSKQYYNYDVARWMKGDPGFPPPPASRWHGRNCDWQHLNNADVFSMPDNWEYPWYASWDLAFHCITLALIDPNLAKRQLVLLCREWSMHPNGQLPAYEWAFGDVNPPVQAWAALRVYKIERRITGHGDRDFLEKIFHKMLLNFTWWVNRKDPSGNNVFQGGFLGMDNIGVFDRSAPLPSGETLEQSDGTAWMGFFSLSMFAIAVELAHDNSVYEDLATKFFEHFLYIAEALNNTCGSGMGLWDDTDGFYYDVLQMPDGTPIPLRVRSMVGLIPLLAVQTIEPSELRDMPEFANRIKWFLNNRKDLASMVSQIDDKGQAGRQMLSLVSADRLKKVLLKMLDPNDFLSDYGIRSVSKYHQSHPFVLTTDGASRSIDYEPAESTTGLFGGNSNWRGPIWFPINYLIIEALQRFDYYYGKTLTVEDPTGSGELLSLWDVSQELSRRLIKIFLPDDNGRRPVAGENTTMQTDPLWKDYFWFHEYFHGDTGKGLGASHQTGWTGLVAKLIQQSGE